MVSLSWQRKYLKPMVAGVTFVSDAYPNVKYKIEYLVQKQNFCSNIKNLHADKSKISFWESKKSHFLIRLTLYTFSCFLRMIRYRPDVVYLPYPGIFLSILFYIVPRKLRPAIYLDSFISIYDTTIIDRQILGSHPFLAKILYCIERRAYLISTNVITDTIESSVYLSNLFDIPIKKFRCCTLAQKPIILQANGNYNNDEILNCLFVGTFVPLQGVDVIAKAILNIKSTDKIFITLIGDGQTGPSVMKIIEPANKLKYIWKREWMTVGEIVKEIQKADICLGIFGNSDKTERVWPFKNYLYLAAGCPLVTKRTPCAETIKGKDNRAPIYLPEKNTAKALVDLLRELSKKKEALRTQRKAAKQFYAKYLSNQIAFKQLEAILSGPAIQNQTCHQCRPNCTTA